QRHTLACSWLTPVVFDDEAMPIEDPDLRDALAHLDGAADQGRGHRVAIRVDGDVALDVDSSVVEVVDLGHECRQGIQVRSLGCEELEGRLRERLPRAIVDSVAPPRNCAFRSSMSANSRPA